MYDNTYSLYLFFENISYFVAIAECNSFKIFLMYSTAWGRKLQGQASVPWISAQNRFGPPRPAQYWRNVG